ncbi:hypothetical protein JMUB4039_2070 [Leptotrichia trevisanii]|uniref:Uncharacterized protein n=1 Tax=Leptotrichia trevisanii TaxID=109328 RepID=A0A510K372_9FUSO|nr:hypothetical protein [Leptotrichia trevisanii]BBM46118.1 hypothetical protein JMUB3870_2245 [Leptotrichia trevisanii]BBM58083.1 hypothetical protein JMUB4039_2070 [Leptotrichia trevisanii]
MMLKIYINKTYGINRISKISLKKVIKEFSFPNDININLSDDRISININLIYSNFRIFYTLYFYVENLNIPEFQTLTFALESLYFDDKNKIKIGDEIRKTLPKIKKYLKRNKKNTNFEYDEDMYTGRYLFDNGKIDIFFKKNKKRKIIHNIMIRLPYEDILPENKEVLKEIKDIIEIKNKIDNFFWK